DKNNYHQFQPLLYQVATAGLEPSSISFPLRKVFQKNANVFIRVTEVKKINTEGNEIESSIGRIPYDYLVLAHGAETNYFGSDNLQQYGYSMKSVSDALLIRNTLLQNYEHALVAKNESDRNALLNIVIVGGGPTGVELAGAIAEMKNKLLPKDYPELNFNSMKIYLLEAGNHLLGGMSGSSSTKVSKYLKDLGVEVNTDTAVKDYDGQNVFLRDGTTLKSRCLIWAAGVKGVLMPGISPESLLPNNRILVNKHNLIQGERNVFAIGDIACMTTQENPKGHPQVAPAAMQQATLLADNLKSLTFSKPLKPFIYQDKGSMATVGRNLAVAEMGRIKFSGFMAWITWMLVHLMSVIGVKNRLFILINWVWQYITYDQSLRLIIKPTRKQRQIEPSHIAEKLETIPLILKDEYSIFK
uniref:NAD(P)/FAD-dependent oxidoreductase n=1 Tax=Arcticibacter eurypsychrophilus TaxID=1434752 RepID=UPI00084D40F3